MIFAGTGFASQGSSGSIRGVVLDKDFEALLPGVKVSLVELSGRSTVSDDQGNYVIPDVPAGRYTVVFQKAGYIRQVRSDVVVTSGKLTEIDVALAGDFTDMEEFIVEEVLGLGAGSEAALLQLRFEAPALLDSVSAELMSRAGASDAASALRLVAGASVQNGKFAVIRGLPDRYVSSQLNGVRLPSADADTRAVELDQFPSTVIESIQVSKTFTPDQQGDASGGAVDVRLRGIPDEPFLRFSGQLGYNDQAGIRDDFLTSEGGGVNQWGTRADDLDVQVDNLGSNWTGAVGVTEDRAPIDYKWSLSGGRKWELSEDLTIGGFFSFFYERDSSYVDDGRNDKLWVQTPGTGLSPQQEQQSGFEDFLTALFDIREATQSVQWGALTSIGAELGDHHSFNLAYLYSRTAEDKVTLAEDTRGKEFYFPGYDPNDPTGPGNSFDERPTAPYLRTQTLQYTERKTGSLQLSGEHVIPFEEGERTSWIQFLSPEVNWVYSNSFARLDQPDKRQFGSKWFAPAFVPGPDITLPATYLGYFPGTNINLGNLQRIYQKIDEESDQISVDLKFPFEQWSDTPGYLKFGLFDDKVDRTFDQETFSNFGDSAGFFQGDFGTFWSEVWNDQNHPITAADTDVDYDGKQDIFAYYGMIDLPLASNFNLVGGARFEETDIDIDVFAEPNATFLVPGGLSPVAPATPPLKQDDVLPSIGFQYEPTEEVTLRGSYSETIARPVFKELSPVIQQEFFGGPLFVGNPDLKAASLENFDLRVDYEPYAGGLLSLSWFRKNIDDPIENVESAGIGTYTTPRNYPSGEFEGWEVEVRQDLGQLWDSVEGLSVGANATFIDSSVEVPLDEQIALANVSAPMSTRDATNAPEHLYNLYATYDVEEWGTQFGLFYTVRGDTLISGATAVNFFVPNIYEKEFDTLNFSMNQRINDRFSLRFQAKNLTNPNIKTIYRSAYSGPDTTRTTFTRGREFSVSININF